MQRIAVGLIGAGKHGIRYTAHIRADVPALSLTALSRRDASAGAAYVGRTAVFERAKFREVARRKDNRPLMRLVFKG